MTTLADEAPTSLLEVVRPVVGRQSPGADPIRRGDR